MKRVAAVQMRSTADVRGNMSAVLRLARAAEERGCEHVSFPENALYLGASRDSLDLKCGAELIDGLQKLLRECASLRSVSVGMLRECAADSSKLHNSLAFVGPQETHFYDKIHLFDYGELKESKGTAAGSRLVVREGYGLSICYDLRFPALYSDLRRRGAEAMLVPSAFTPRTGAAHWHALLRARAIETQSLVIAAAQVGQHNERRASYGHALIYDAWGDLLAESEGDSEQLVVAEWDTERQTRIRAEMPLLEHERAFK